MTYVQSSTAAEPHDAEQAMKDHEKLPLVRPRILVADDEPSIRTIVGYALSHQGWQVTTVEDGSDVAKVLEVCASAQAPFDLAILDIDMPQMDGHETFRQIHERYPDLPVLFISGWPREVVWNNQAEQEAEFVAKPFSIAYLVDKVRSLLAGA